MPVDPSIVVVSATNVLMTAMLGLVVYQFRKSDRNSNGIGKPVDPRSNPHGTPLGVVPWAHYQESMRELSREHDKFSENLALRYDSTGLAIIGEMRELRKVTETHIKLHH